MPDENDILRQLFAVFRQEQSEHAAAIRALLGASETKPGAGGEGLPRELDTQALEEVYRRVHSLKGAARAVDLALVETIAHHTEALLARVRSGAARVDPAVLRGRLEDFLDVCEALTLTAHADPDAADRRAAESAANTLLRQIEAVPSAAASAPVPHVANTAKPPAPTSPPERQGAGAPAPSGEYVRLGAWHLDSLLTIARQLLREADRQRPALDDLERLERALSGDQRDESPGETEARARALLRRLRRTQQENEWRLGRLVRDLLDSVREARTVTASASVEGLDRMVHALARQQGKEIEWTVTGGDVAIDRQLAQALRDPLTHLLRNTISHGIESPNERISRGKPARGGVRIDFSVRGGRLEIAVEDDGRGVDAPALRRAAVAAGLLAAGAAAELSADDVSRLAFSPGLSTATTADRIAGRGMGLSIVAQSVARLGGDVRLEPSPPGTGARFRLSLPVSLLTERLVLAEAGGRTYGFPTWAVERLHRAAATEREHVAGEERLRLPDGAGSVPLARLDRIVGAPAPAAAQTPQKRQPVVVLRSPGGERCAIVVDHFVREVEAVLRPLGPYLAGVTLVTGSLILEDGTVALALAPGEMMARVRAASATEAAVASSARGAPADGGARSRERALPPSVLVVDDSITTRALMRSIFESHDYRVRIATDGAEALTLLRESQGVPDRRIDVVVSDIEMPRMTGFELLEALRADPRLSGTPVILVTSREAFEDRERGLSLGADAYLVKQRFDHRELLEAVEQLVL